MKISRRASQPFTGIVLTIFAGFCLAFMDAMGKHLAVALPVMMVVWGRYFSQTMISGAILSAREGPRFLRTRRPLVQFLRGVALLSATLLMYTALRHVPLADATSAVFVTPILVALFSAVFLKESIGLCRLGAIVAGFAGVVLIVRPGAAGTSAYLLLPLAAACLNAAYLMLTRLLSDERERHAAQFHTTSVGAVVLTLAVIPEWTQPDYIQLSVLAAMGILGLVAHYSLLAAMRYASASILSPYLYGQVLAATLISVFWFGDPLAPTMVAGTVLLIGSGLFLWWRERRQNAYRPSAPRTAADDGGCLLSGKQ